MVFVEFVRPRRGFKGLCVPGSFFAVKTSAGCDVVAICNWDIDTIALIGRGPWNSFRGSFL
jgi:hypothetical protein